MSTKYDIAVFIGRFQPFHNGHQRVVDYALNIADNVLILVGSSNRSANIRNPWSFEHRERMIRGVYQDQQRVFIKPLDDVMYNDDSWITQVQQACKDAIVEIMNPDTHPHATLHGVNDARVTLVGCEKDHTSYYLKLFPGWSNEGVEFLDPINATDLREDYFNNGEDWKRFVSPLVANYLDWYKETAEFFEFQELLDFVDKYKTSVHKYPRIEHTVDAVVVQSGHVLLIRRRANPGKGMLALPGGFVDVNETLEDAAIRELREETKIKVPEKVLRGSIVKTKTYDDPHRSSRGRIITQAYHIELEPQTELPKVRGSDDADKAAWVPLSEISAKTLYEDHYWIITNLIGV